MRLSEAGGGRISTHVAALVDTNVLVYVFDPADRRKQRIASELLDRGLQEDTIRVPHQVVVEFVAAVTRPRTDGLPLLSKAAAYREAEELLAQFVVLYPTEALVRTALRGAAAYQLPWYDAHLWAYAEHYGLSELYSEDFEHGRLYGTVRAVNPFLG
jgi:predicted nucleic acid-binding protein